MNKQDQNKKYVPGRGYLHICDFCKIGFYGRLNKKYHKQCKVAFNNLKASKFNKTFGPIKSVIIKNEKILRNNYYESATEDGVDMDKLLAEGLDPKVFTGIYELENLKYYRCSRYLFAINERTGRVIIKPFLNIKI